MSNNARNRALDDVVVVRITTSEKPELPGIVELGADDPLVGWILCDDLGPLYRDEIRDDLGALANQTMFKVAGALLHVLAVMTGAPAPAGAGAPSPWTTRGSHTSK